MSNPLQIIFEILSYLTVNTWENLQFISGKLVELFISLIQISSQNFLGLIIASVIGGVAIYFILKYIFGTTRFFVLVLILFIIAVVFVLRLVA